MTTATGTGTREDPWQLKTPPGTSEYQMWRDDASDPPTIVCQVGGTRLLYDARAIDDLHARPTIRSAAGTASRRASVDVSASTCRRCSRPSGSPS
jgi:hypothetical protein